MNVLIGIGGTGLKVVEATIVSLLTGFKPCEDLANNGLVICCMDIDNRNPKMQRIQTIIENYNAVSGYIDDRFCKPVQFKAIQNAAYISIGNARMPRLFDILRSAPADKCQNLASALFKSSQKNLDLQDGTKGDAQLGSLVVAQQFENDGNFDSLITSIVSSAQGAGVRICITGSIFGGSGSSGMPTIYRKVRERILTANAGNQTMGNAKMGLVLMLPYFGYGNVNNDLYAVQSSEHVLRSKVALKYYSQLEDIYKPEYMSYIGGAQRPMKSVYDENGVEYLQNENSFDELQTAQQKAATGGGDQDNPAMLEELYAALSCLHFFSGEADEHDEYMISSSVTEFNVNTLPFGAQFSNKLRLFNRFVMTYEYYFRRRIYAQDVNQKELNNSPLRHYFMQNNAVNVSTWRNSTLFKHYDACMPILARWFNEICYNATPENNCILNRKDANTFVGLVPRLSVIPVGIANDPRIFGGHSDTSSVFHAIITQMQTTQPTTQGIERDKEFINNLFAACQTSLTIN